MSTGYRPVHNQPEIRHLTRMFERGQISGEEFHKAVVESRRKGTEKPDYTVGPRTTRRADHGQITKAVRKCLRKHGALSCPQIKAHIGYQRNRLYSALHYLIANGEVKRRSRPKPYPHVYEYVGNGKPNPSPKQKRPKAKSAKRLAPAPWKDGPSAWDKIEQSE